METTITKLVHLHAPEQTTGNIWKKILEIADKQTDNKTLWFLFSLVFQGVLFLPIPAVLMYYYEAPIIVLPITFGLYLSNIIAGMGGSGLYWV